MGLNDKVLSHIRMMANGVAASANEKTEWAVATEVRRMGDGARITVSLRPGAIKPSDTLLELGDVADAIRNELRLDRDKLGKTIYGTSESTFESEGNPYFTFEVWLL